MDEMQRRRLTEFLCECWHELIRYKPGSIFKKCKKCGLGGDPENRSFDTWPDLGALLSKIKEDGKLYDFLAFVGKEYTWMSWEELDVEDKISTILDYIKSLA